MEILVIPDGKQRCEVTQIRTFHNMSIGLDDKEPESYRELLQPVSEDFM